MAHATVTFRTPGYRDVSTTVAVRAHGDQHAAITEARLALMLDAVPSELVLDAPTVTVAWL